MMKRMIYKALYKYIGGILPVSDARLSFGAKQFRGAMTRGFVTKAGKNINIEKGAIFDSSIEIGNNSGIGIDSQLYGKVIIGNDVMMGPEVFIYTANHKYQRLDIPMNVQGHEDENPVVIGNDVWIGSRVTILPGKRIGNGVIIGASSVVTKDINDYEIVAGNPARVIGYRKTTAEK